MKRLKYCLLAALLPLLPGAMKAEQVNWAAFGNFIVQNNGALLTNAAPGSTLLLVHFTAAANLGQSYSSLLASNSFTLYDTSFIGENGAPAGEFSASTFTVGVPSSTQLPGTAGEQLYMWFFNSSDPATATQAAIITNPAWVRPGDGATVVSYDASQLGTFIPTNAPGGINNNSQAPGILIGDVRLSPVPEPSTYALALVGLGVAGVVARRRRATVA